MKIYFDDVTRITSSNCESLSRNGLNNFWLTSPGTRLKQELRSLGVPFYKLDDLDEPGLYFVEVNGDPQWWCGLCKSENGPDHILTRLPNNIIKLVRRKQLRLVISADREGGGMIHNGRDGFLATTLEMERLSLPYNSVFIIQGNKKIEQQYNQWLIRTGNKKLFDVKYVNHFDKIFIDSTTKSLEYPVILDSIKVSKYDYNSLNRSYKDHRLAHLYHLAKSKMLDKGLVSANEIRFNQLNPLSILEQSVTLEDLDTVLKQHYPKYVDGDWSINNAANFVNIDIFKNSLISFITETKFDEDVIFLTEKVFKSLAYGHPMIVLGACGTLSALRELGYKTNWCGIDPSYNDIVDNRDRFYATHKVLEDWISLSKEEKIKKITDSIPTLEHNMSVSKNNNFYYSNLIDAINISKDYFND